jgi:4-amino-4-deoxychorismate lyase
MSNIIFFDGLSWVTPARPLLKGTCRERLLASGLILERDISVNDLSGFTGCKLINAMRDPEREAVIPTERIIF